MHKNTLIFGGAVVASVFVSLLLFYFLEKPNKNIYQRKQNTSKTANLLIPLTDKQLTSTFVTYNIKTTIEKVELSSKGIILSIDNTHVKTLVVSVATNVTSTNSENSKTPLTIRNLTKGQSIKATIRQNLLRNEPPLISQILILSPLPTPSPQASVKNPSPTLSH